MRTIQSITTVLLLSVSTFSGAVNLPPPATDEDFQSRDPAREKLGKLLFFDKVISGNKNTSCATCHHPFAATGDGLSLPVGEGGVGLGVTRDTGTGLDAIHERVPRNAPHIFNLGAKEFDTMFYDGRVQVDASQPSGFLTPVGDQFPIGIVSSALSAQAMFPVTSPGEMAGQAGENPIADAAAADNIAGPGGVWEQLAGRLQAIDEYVELFKDAFDDIDEKNDITFAHAAEAIGAFESAAWRCDNSRFDQFLRGNRQALSVQEKRGMKIFYHKKKANCVKCHSGTFQTDQQFHAIAMPQIGPGKGDNQDGYSDGHDDFGRARVTAQLEDRFRFRTPSLRMVAQTGPWGHSGPYNDLEAVVRHHMDSVGALMNYDAEQAVLPFRYDLDAQDFIVANDAARLAAIGDASEIEPFELNDRQFGNLIAFLHALTDTSCIDLRRDVPKSVPSGLSLAEQSVLIDSAAILNAGGVPSTVVARAAAKRTGKE
jgi:cytochrome c peroxidase